jgi:hypothetical protein
VVADPSTLPRPEPVLHSDMAYTHCISQWCCHSAVERMTVDAKPGFDQVDNSTYLRRSSNHEGAQLPLVRLASRSSTTAICAAQRFLLSIPAETSAVLASIGRHLFSHLETTAGIEVDVWDEGEMRVKPPRDRSADPVDHDYPLLFAYPVPWKWYRELISCRPPLLKSMPLLARGEELFEVDL